MAVIVPEHQIGAEVSVSDVRRKVYGWWSCKSASEQSTSERSGLMPLSYHLQHCIMPDIIAPEM